MLLLSHPTGNANVRAAARAFHSAGWLTELDSCLCWDPQAPLAHLLPGSLAAQLERRSFSDVPLSLQHSHPWREMARLAIPTLPLLRMLERGPLSITEVYRSFDRHVADRLNKFTGLQAVYAYEDGSLFTFQAAERLGLYRFYDLPIGYWRAARAIFEEERDLLPAWASTLTGLQDSAAKLSRKDAELHLADAVIVPSQFVRSTLLIHHACSAQIYVAPFGAPPPFPELPVPTSSGPLRVLYVGSLSQRKGLAYLLEAVQILGSQVSLTMIGRPTTAQCQPLNAAMNNHKWLASLPHSQILDQMRRHDVLVLPSLFEGFALVIGEALSQGLTVISTFNSGATEIINDGVEGFIVPIRSSQAIAERLQQLADNRDQLGAMRQACLRRAAALSWAGYEHALRVAVGQALSHAPVPA
jgi:starch synthase